MANRQHVEWLKEGTEKWNARRKAAFLHERGLPFYHTGVTEPDESLLNPDLAEASLRWANLQGMNLQGANLMDAKLFGANLIETDLQDANLLRADLIESDLRSAKLPRADLRNVKLIEADLRNAKLFGANLFGANLQGANLLRTDLRSIIRLRSTNDGSRWHFTNLVHTYGLLQEMLEGAIGDTGVILPVGLWHPNHWPGLTEDQATGQQDELVEVEEKNNLYLAFVFLSYSHEDREVADQIHPLLLKQSMPVWWDQDLLPGQIWATEIKQHLDDAAAALVLWTKNSVESASVIEEARQAQSRGALVHARMDDADLPYGFSETQYADLRGWDGTADHPEMRKLLQALRDKLSPPGSKEIEERLVSNSPIGTQIEDGKISFADTPVDANPPKYNPEELAARIEGQIQTAEDLVQQNQEFESNAVPNNFDFLINRYKKNCRLIHSTGSI